MITISTLEPQETKPFKPSLRMRLQIALLHVQHLFAGRYRAECGHETYLKNTLPRFPECGVVTLAQKKNKGVALCHQCLEEGGIRCAWCNEPILFGDRITLYCVNGNSPALPHAVIVNEKSTTAVGCMCCADDISGRWIPPGAILNLDGNIIHV